MLYVYVMHIKVHVLKVGLTGQEMPKVSKVSGNHQINSVSRLVTFPFPIYCVNIFKTETKVCEICHVPFAMCPSNLTWQIHTTVTLLCRKPLLCVNPPCPWHFTGFTQECATTVFLNIGIRIASQSAVQSTEMFVAETLRALKYFMKSWLYGLLSIHTVWIIINNKSVRLCPWWLRLCCPASCTFDSL